MFARSHKLNFFDEPMGEFVRETSFTE